MKPLFVYGTLCPGRSNASILEEIGGEWLRGTVTGFYYERGWGAAADFPGIVLDEQAPAVQGYLFISGKLQAHWQQLDEFEEGYDRVPVEVTRDDGEKITAWVYQLQPQGDGLDANRASHEKLLRASKKGSEDPLFTGQRHHYDSSSIDESSAF